MAMKSSMMLWLCNLMFLLLAITFFIKPVSCIEAEALSTPYKTYNHTSVSYYSDYCSSTVPESTPDYYYHPTYKFFGPFREYESGYYYSGSGNRILNSNITRYLNSFVFRTRLVYRTDRDGVFKIESSLVFQSPYYNGNMPYRLDISSSSPLILKLQGFWSEPSGKLCMVGSGSAYPKDGKLLIPDAVLKLSNLKNFNNITSLITGTLISNDKDYFEPVSLLMIPQSGYNYTFVSEEFVDFFSGESDNMKSLPYKGFAVPLSVGDRLYTQHLYPQGVPFSSRPVRTALSGPVNLSYEIGITLRLAPKVDGGVVLYNLTSIEKVEITFGGVYDADTGALCMVGCRKIGSNSQVFEDASLDCGILLNFQLPPLKPNKNGGLPLTVSSAAYSAEQAKQSIWTMDLEIIMVLISNTLVCIFVGLQLYHVKKNPEVLSFISLVMLVILTLDYMIPLVLNFEALFSKKQGQNSVLVHSAGWLEVNVVIVRIITMLAFLFQFRLLQLALSARSNDENQRGLWFAEKMTLLVTVSIYAVGAFITMLVNWGKHSPEFVNQHKHSPKILLNIFSNSRGNTLSCSFYVGITFISLLPHVYDLCSKHKYIQLKGTYIFVNPSEDFFSTASDVFISLGVLLFAAIIYLQQRLGGRCILPGRDLESRKHMRRFQ
ncbi:hypothetical protein REPUB_Repub11eG0057600 [Reevesia pubescens]